LSFAETGAVETFEQFPPMQDFGKLIEDYRIWQAQV
jgi:hypothetical protein